MRMLSISLYDHAIDSLLRDEGTSYSSMEQADAEMKKVTIDGVEYDVVEKWESDVDPGCTCLTIRPLPAQQEEPKAERWQMVKRVLKYCEMHEYNEIPLELEEEADLKRELTELLSLAEECHEHELTATHWYLEFVKVSKSRDEWREKAEQWHQEATRVRTAWEAKREPQPAPTLEEEVRPIICDGNGELFVSKEMLMNVCRVLDRRLRRGE